MKLINALAIAGTLVAGAARAESPDEIVQRLQAEKIQKGWSFDVGVTPMTGVTNFGFLRLPDWKTKAKWSVPPRHADLPAHWDWRDKGVVTPIRDQASPVYCGSCWAHGTAAAFESAIAIKTGNPPPSIAPQQLVSCEPSYGTCEGGDFAFGFYTEVGANHEVDFPYQAEDVACKEGAPTHEKAANWGYVGSDEREPTTDELKNAIYTYGPIAVTVASSSSWSSYKGGIYDACDSQDINHIVAIVGWDDTDQTWIVKNSHGTKFGEQGYMRTKWVGKDGEKCNGIGGSAAYVVPAG